MRRQVLDAVRRFDPGAQLEGPAIRLSDATVLPNETRALQWIITTYQARARSPREAAEVDPELRDALDALEHRFGPVQVVEVRPNKAGPA